MSDEWSGKRKAENLIAFLRSQRWFGGKGRHIRDARLTDIVPVTWRGPSKEFAVARARVTTDEGSATYQLFLSDTDKFSDALEDAAFRRGLVDAFLQGSKFVSGGTSWIVESKSAQPLVVPATAPITMSKSEQTNSSMIIDEEAILKLYRKLEAGIHPDVEVTHFLTIERRFVHVPVLLGTVRFENSDGTTIAGMLQELVPGAVDGWSYALSCSANYFRAGEGEDLPLPFVQEAKQLGIVTRALHDALASGDPGSEFDLRPAAPDDIRAWVAETRRTIEDATTALARAVAEKQLPPEEEAGARTILDRRPGYLAWVSELSDGIGSDAGANSRTHGDYHLGQVLRSAAGQFLVIDFEGEPTRPLAERRARRSPVRDVAGMLRSFSYAAAVSGGKEEAGSYAAAIKTRTPSRLALAEIRSSRWERSSREAFLRGYFSEKTGNPALLPRSQNNAGRLIALFEAEKVFYELQYELDHRPDWAWVPLRGIAKLYA